MAFEASLICCGNPSFSVLFAGILQPIPVVLSIRGQFRRAFEGRNRGRDIPLTQQHLPKCILNHGKLWRGFGGALGKADGLLDLPPIQQEQ